MTPPIETITADTAIADDSEDNAPLLAHDYDGIREYDNPMPGWWKSIFLGSVMFAGFYGLYFHLLDWGHTDGERYQTQLADYESKKEIRARAEAANVSEAALTTAGRDPKMVEKGELVFKSRCVSCHADDGRGLIGPNLTDLRQLHGTTRMDLYTTISNGAPGTAMLAWGEQLPQADVVAVAAFVTTLRGKNIAGKSGEGQPVTRFEP
ncbi:MAG: c-type cytochrome [Deltaproteobacteria bacterium]|nr:c-type cytochrome [Deltaproteobacteria bacterium]